MGGGAPPPGMPPPGMGGGGAPPGSPPIGTGPATAPGPQAGSAAQGMSQVKLAVEMLQKSLVGIPMGSPLHNDVMKAISSLSKNIAQGAEDEFGIL